MWWQDRMAEITYWTLRAEITAARWFRMNSLSTSRSFWLYRQLFFEGRSEEEVLSSLRDQVIVDVGCGFTPYFSDSMFQACEAAGISFYGVDPVLAKGMRSPWYARTVAFLTGSRGRYLAEPAGLERTLGVYADDIPLASGSVDKIFASVSLFIWVDREEDLAKIFKEFHRLLREGGEVHVYPLPPWESLRWRSVDFLSALNAFSISQVFVSAGLRWESMPAYRTVFKKK
ncbi:MAG: class I SAM-dependent methyltransferase [Myxococcales bacterium]|nr:class I SAM-dependent methyltransferase [Myxococcales bacterium]